MIAGAVLAGGKSKRMGQDKALVTLSGEPLAVRQAKVLEQAGCSPVVLVGRQPGLSSLGLQVLSGESAAAHPLTGIVHALESLPDQLVLFCPVDLPGLTPIHVAALLELQAPCTAVGPSGVQPLLCVLGPNELSMARDLLTLEGSATALVSGLPSVQLPSVALINCNSPDDIASFSDGLRVKALK